VSPMRAVGVGRREVVRSREGELFCINEGAWEGVSSASGVVESCLTQLNKSD
jgi:hypothetical protein